MAVTQRGKSRSRIGEIPATSDDGGRLATPPPASDFTDQERDLVIRSVIASEALEGFTVPRGLAEDLLDQVLREPLIELE